VGRATPARDPLTFTDGSVPRSHQGVAEVFARRGAIRKGRARIEAIDAYGAFVFNFMAVDGLGRRREIARLFERAATNKLPVSSSMLGARACRRHPLLMQMAKTVAARERLRDAGVPFVSVLSIRRRRSRRELRAPRRREHRRARRLIGFGTARHRDDDPPELPRFPAE